jgi:hypothetical protein
MRLAHPLLLNAKAQDKPYKIRCPDSSSAGMRFCACQAFPMQVTLGLHAL